MSRSSALPAGSAQLLPVLPLLLLRLLLLSKLRRCKKLREPRGLPICRALALLLLLNLLPPVLLLLVQQRLPAMGTCGVAAAAGQRLMWLSTHLCSSR